MPAATKWNKLGADLDYLAAGRPGMCVYGSPGQTFATSTPATVLHSSVLYTQGGMAYSSGTITVPEAGVYAIMASIACFGSGIWTATLVIGGTLWGGGEGQVRAAHAATMVTLAAGGTVICQAQTTAGATIATQGGLPMFAVQRVG